MTPFSFVISCYNYGRYLDDCLGSVIGQDYPRAEFEMICVDDGSTDETPRLLAEWAKKATSALKVITLKNGGLEKACNAGIRAASHEFVIRLDADDSLSPGFMIAMDRAVRENPDTDFYYCKDYVEYYSEAERYPKSLPAFDKDEIFTRGDFFATGTAYKKQDLAGIGLFPEEIKNCGLENYAVVLALLTAGKRGLAVGGASFLYRRHHRNMSTVRRKEIIEYGKQLLKSYGRPFTTNSYHPYGLRLDAQEAVV